jgi:hypothetical protein
MRTSTESKGTTVRRRRRRVLPLAAALGAVSLLIGTALEDATRAQGPVQFEREVWPIFHDKCVTCHGPEDQFNDLRLDSKDRILKGGKNGKVVVPGDPTKSSLYVRVSLPPDDLDIMPAEGDPLTAAQIDTLKRWIAEGADFGSWTGGG